MCITLSLHRILVAIFLSSLHLRLTAFAIALSPGLVPVAIAGFGEVLHLSVPVVSVLVTVIAALY